MAQKAAEKRTSDMKAAMFKKAFCTFSVKDVRQAKDFYTSVLGLDVFDEMEGLGINIPGGGSLFLYPKDDHEPASFTVFNLQVDDIEEAVEELKARGITFESYGGEIETDENGIHRGKEKGEGPNIAWFKDPSGNILSVIETD